MEENTMEWISVKDRTPKHLERVKVRWSDGDETISIWTGYVEDEVVVPILWMPLVLPSPSEL